MTLSDTQSLVLSKASRHEAGLAAAPPGLPAAARDAVVRSMLKNKLLAECAAPREHDSLAWRRDEDGTGVALRITEAGLRAIGLGPDGAAAPERGPETAVDDVAAPGTAVPLGAAIAALPRHGTVRDAAQAVLEAWDVATDREAGRAGALGGAMERLRAALAKPAAAAGGARGTPREGTKGAAVLALLRRPEGASGPQLAEATGCWAPHTVRGFLAGLRKKGVTLAVLERVRQVGPGKAGAKGSHSVYRVVEAG